jgi:hypothetical protein
VVRRKANVVWTVRNGRMLGGQQQRQPRMTLELRLGQLLPLDQPESNWWMTALFDRANALS